VKRKVAQLILLLLPATLMAQPQLSREEMRQDYDFLVKIIKETYPQLEVIRLVTGKDILAEIKDLRSSIDTVTAFSSYYKLVGTALHLTQEQHHHIIYCDVDDDLCEPDNYYINDSIRKQSVLLAKEIRQNIQQWSFRKSPFMGLYYINGQYYFMQDLLDGNDKTTVLFPKSARVLQINGIDIDRYILTVSERIGSNLRWDAAREKYYAKASTYIDIDDTIKVTLELPDGSMKEQYIIRGQTRLFNQGTMSTDDYDPKVLYFDDSKLLYIRIPEMDLGLLPFYEEEIAKMKQHPIDKVVIDVRGNVGGSDRVWWQTLSAIIDTTLTWPATVLFKNTPTVISYFNRVRGDTLSPIQPADVIIGRDTLFASRDRNFIEPAANTLAYKGRIYVLADERCYSSTKSFLSACNKIDRLVSVGKPADLIAGIGINPFVFALPYSNLIFRINVSLESIEGDNLADYYDRIEIPVEMSLQEALFEENWTGERYGEEYLFNHDPIFQKVLEQKE
jgi:hypothetical protein